MNDYLSRAGLTILIMVTVILAVIYVKYLSEQKTVRIIRIPDPNYIPSPMEIQQALKDLNEPRYDPGRIDGIIGRESQAAWDNYINDQSAIKEFR